MEKESLSNDIHPLWGKNMVTSILTRSFSWIRKVDWKVIPVDTSSTDASSTDASQRLLSSAVSQVGPVLPDNASMFAYLVVDEGFLTGGPYVTPALIPPTAKKLQPFELDETFAFFPPSSIEKIRASYEAGKFGGPYEVADCISMYGTNILTKRRNLLAITRPTNQSTRTFLPPAFLNRTMFSNNSDDVWEYPSKPPLWSGSSLLAFEFEGTNRRGWLCNGYEYFADKQNLCNAAVATELLEGTKTWDLHPYGFSGMPYPIEYCLSEEDIAQKCELRYGLHALLPLDSRIPIHGNLSLAISAACHPLRPKNEGKAMYEHEDDTCYKDSGHLESAAKETSIAAKPLKWGAVRQARNKKTDFDRRIGHCSLTSEPVEMPIPGRRYA
ncbi:MAG: hypothetical protein Q9227_007660 [Pyrenula ochraceoflavens]